MSYVKERIQAFGYAFSGIAAALKKETNLKLQACCGLLVTGLALLFQVSRGEWLILLLCITLVLALEMFNSALEKLCDLVMPERHPSVQYIKDVMAGAVLLACLFSAVAGLIIFIPYL